MHGQDVRAARGKYFSVSVIVDAKPTKYIACLAYIVRSKLLAVLEHDRTHTISDRFTLVDAVFEQTEDR